MSETQFPTYPEAQDYEDDTVYEPAQTDTAGMEPDDDEPLDGLDLATDEDDYTEKTAEERGALKVQGVGVMYLKAAPGLDADLATLDGDAYKFPCTSASLTLGINAIPQAVVYVGMGSSMLSAEARSNINALLQALIDPARKTRPSGVDNRTLPSDLIRCAIYEEATGEEGHMNDIKVFDGYIVSGGPIYAASADASSAQAMFVCCGKAAALMTAPGAAYVETYMSGLIQRYQKNKPIDAENAKGKHDLFIGLKMTDEQLLAMKEFHTDSSKTISNKLALCVGAVRLNTAWTDVKDDETRTEDLADKLVLAAIGGSTRLKTGAVWDNGLPDAADEAYTRQLLGIFTGRMSKVSIWETIVSVMSSDQFALHLIPRWHCDYYNDFKMEVCPSVAWNQDRPVIKLTAADVVSFKMDHRSTDALNTPDVLFVNFSEVYPNIAGSTDLASGVLGVAAGDKKLNDELQGLARSKDLVELNRRVAMYRVKETTGPAWLSCVAKEPGVVVNNEQDLKSLSAQHTPARTADETAGVADSTTQPSFNVDANEHGVSVYDAANSMARALFLHYYMTGDNAVVDLLPDCRFGLREVYCLENSLGETVDINLANDATGLSLHVRGVITGLNYAYASGKASSSKYQMMLSRVRVVDGDEEPLAEPCPIYSVDPPLEPFING